MKGVYVDQYVDVALKGYIQHVNAQYMTFIMCKVRPNNIIILNIIDHTWDTEEKKINMLILLYFYVFTIQWTFDIEIDRSL